jgi:transposase-like protein
MSSPMQHNAALSAKQRAVLLEVARGATVKAASERAGIDRCTYYRWLKQPAFSQALAEARDDFAEALRDQFHELEIVALLTLRMLLENDKTPPAVRLRAALAVLGHGKSSQPLSACLPSLRAVASPGATQSGTELESGQFDKMQHAFEELAAADLPENPGTGPETEPEPQIDAVSGPGATQCNTLSNRWRQTPRGAPCPCGSGRKYKRCCGVGTAPLYTEAAA